MADTKLVLMSNILLSDSPTSSNPGSRHYGSSMSILPGIIGRLITLQCQLLHIIYVAAMPEEDNSILGESVYQHLRYEQREAATVTTQPLDLKMFEQQQQQQQQLASLQLEAELGPELEYGEWSREDIYQSISRGQAYKPVLKKIGSRHMLVLNNQQTLSRGSTSKI